MERSQEDLKLKAELYSLHLFAIWLLFMAFVAVAEVAAVTSRDAEDFNRHDDVRSCVSLCTHSVGRCVDFDRRQILISLRQHTVCSSGPGTPVFFHCVLGFLSTVFYFTKVCQGRSRVLGLDHFGTQK